MEPKDPNINPGNNQYIPTQPDPVFQPTVTPTPQQQAPQIGSPAPQPQVMPPVPPSTSPQQYAASNAQLQATNSQVLPQTQPIAAQPVYAAPGADYGKKSNKTLLIVLIIVGALIILGALGFGISKMMNKSTNTSKSNGVGEEVVIKKDAKMGETVDINGLAITTTPFEKRAELAQYVTAGAGKTFYVTLVTVKNNTSNKIDIFPSDFKLQTSTSQEFSGTDVYESAKKLPNSALLPGGMAEGYIAFEIPTDTDKAMVLSKAIYPEDISKDIVKFTVTYPTK